MAQDRVPIDADDIDDFLHHWAGLAELCTQGGWIDNDTLAWHVTGQTGHRVRLFVQFEEVLMEGSGCRAGEAQCHGYVVVQLNPSGGVAGARVE
ncbi:hypothetical protein ACN2MM_05455 [Alkalilimnicola ehrlichii MLHE-1]|nr:hypothetical protein [Alkalilimnicola ehrlichii]